MNHKAVQKPNSEFAKLSPPVNLGPPDEVIDEILNKMFPQFRTRRNAERKSGFSQSVVYTIQLFEGRREIIPAAVKIAPSYVIEREKAAYDKYIYKRLPHATPLQNSVDSGNKKWAGLHYELVGAGIREGQSLSAYLSSDETQLADVKKTMNILLSYMSRLWKVSDAFQGFSLRDSYDHLLPVNLIIKPMSLPPNKTILLTPHTVCNKQNLNIGMDSCVRVEGFEVIEVNPYQTKSEFHEYTLNHSTPPGDVQPSSYRLRIQWETLYPPKYSPRKWFSPTTGKVINTRANLLKMKAQTALKSNIIPVNLDDPLLPLHWLDQIFHLPNPLECLNRILDQAIDVRVATIHGDLQVENIRVDPITGDVSLIDFADARRDHVLHDLLRLETSLVTKWLSKVLQERGVPSSTIYPFYQQLHCASFHPAHFQPSYLPTALEKPFAALTLIRNAAANLLSDKLIYQEYYDGLTIYLLGTLKFKEMDPFTHQVAFWGAATIQSLLSSDHELECSEFFPPSSL